MSQQFCLRLSESQKWPYIRKKINSSHFFALGCKTPGGFLFAMFDIVMPILEQYWKVAVALFSVHDISCHA